MHFWFKRCILVLCSMLSMFYWYSNCACKTHHRTPYTSQAIFPVGYLLRFINNPHKANFDVCKKRQCECINTQMAIRETTLSLLEFTCVCSFYIVRWIATKAILEGNRVGRGGWFNSVKTNPLSSEMHLPWVQKVGLLTGWGTAGDGGPQLQYEA